MLKKHEDGSLLLTCKIEWQKNILVFLSTCYVPSRFSSNLLISIIFGIYWLFLAYEVLILSLIGQFNRERLQQLLFEILKFAIRQSLVQLIFT